MKAKTVDGREIELKPNLLDELRIRIKGMVLTPDDTGYEEARTVWNDMIDKKPAFVVRCLGTADVIECVRFSRENDLLLCIKGGGNNIAGLAVAEAP
jgi:FAD/FMN-containing dehydrogenase